MRDSIYIFYSNGTIVKMFVGPNGQEVFQTIDTSPLTTMTTELATKVAWNVRIYLMDVPDDRASVSSLPLGQEHGSSVSRGIQARVRGRVER